MKFFHLSDLHIGKKVHEYSMIEDQKFVLNQIIELAKQEKPDAILLCGDIYDKSQPSAEAVLLFDEFLTNLSKLPLSVLIISGNHDSAERLSFGSNILNQNNIFFSTLFNGKITPITLNDEFGEVNFYPIPFLKPIQIKKYFENQQIENYNDAFKLLLNSISLDKTKRNVCLSHQFLTGATVCESEEIFVGSLENINSALFGDFDYVALGHIHSPQNVLKETVRYCGTLLKYSFSEASHKKSLTVVELKEKNNININLIEIHPLHDLRELKGKFEILTNPEIYKNTNLNDYIHITLTDEEDVVDALSRLRDIYPNLMKLDYDNSRTRKHLELNISEQTEKLSPNQLFFEFYQNQNNAPISDHQEAYITNLFERILKENEWNQLT